MKQYQSTIKQIKQSLLREEAIILILLYAFVSIAFDNFSMFVSSVVSLIILLYVLLRAHRPVFFALYLAVILLSLQTLLILGDFNIINVFSLFEEQVLERTRDTFLMELLGVISILMLHQLKYNQQN